MSDTTYYVLIRNVPSEAQKGSFMNKANATDSDGNNYFIVVFGKSIYEAINSRVREKMGFVETDDLAATLDGYYLVNDPTTAFSSRFVVGND